MAPHIVAGNDPQLPQFLSAVDAAIADTMRSLLHDTAFQRLEATWRGVQWLLAGSGEFDEGDLEISLLHLTREDLRALAHPDSALGLRLDARGADATPWSLVVADFAFGPSEGDLRDPSRSWKTRGQPRRTGRRRSSGCAGRVRRYQDAGRPEDLDRTAG